MDTDIKILVIDDDEVASMRLGTKRDPEPYEFNRFSRSAGEEAQGVVRD